MRRAASVLALLVPLFAGSCSRDADATAPMTLDLRESRGHSGVGMRTGLSGDEEVPPRATAATGRAVFQLSGDGRTMRYRLEVSDIRNVVQSHIHLGAAGTNGPIVQFLFGLVPAGGGASPEHLAAGEFTAEQFTGPLKGHPMSDLVAAIRSGGAYVNVHTNDGDATPNTGPGDFPGGEIRGQLGDRDAHAGDDGDHD